MMIMKYLYEIKENDKYNIYKAIALIDTSNMQNENKIKNNDFLVIDTKHNQKFYRLFINEEDDNKVLNMLAILFKDTTYLKNAEFLRKEDKGYAKEILF